MKSTPQVAAFLSNPTLQTDEKTKGLKDLLGRLGGSTSDLTKNLLSVLAENGRLYDTEKVVEGFEQIMSAHRGELEVTITCEFAAEIALVSSSTQLIHTHRSRRDARQGNDR